MSMVRWEPFRELMGLRKAMDRLFDDSFIRPWRILGVLGEEGQLPIDMYQTDKEVVVKAALPGVKPEKVAITITGDTLSIKGETKAMEEVKREDYLYREHRYGAFSRSMILPTDLKTDKAEANFENGVLTLTIPRPEEAKPKTIKVKTKGTIEGEKK
jgi:HSP20 family protein